MREDYPHHIFVAFAFNYDVNMIVKDFPPSQLQRLVEGDTAYFSGFRIKWLRTKWLEVWKGDAYVKIYDVFTFFGCSFLKACQQYLGNVPDLVEVSNGKSLRNEFRFDELESLIRPYMYKELHLMVRLVEQLRELLETIDVRPSGWHGPGAIASALLRKNKLKRAQDVPEIRTAAAMAYAGGRFECFKTGLYTGDVYQYDVRSAYPYALTQVPDLNQKYQLLYGLEDPPDFSLCHIVYEDQDREDPYRRLRINPFAFRNERGSIYYQGGVDTWVWGCELKAALPFFGDKIEIKEIYWFPDDGSRPFDFVNELYERRAQWKREGNPAQLAAKLGMNSLYGKTAQRVGWNKEKGTAPTYHQLRWAGFTTAYCRSLMLSAMMQDPDSIISVETDGIFSTKPLNLNIGPHLGQFEETKYGGILYIQSGVYFTSEDGEWSKGKTRGFSPNKANIDLALNTVESLEPLRVVDKRFMGMPAHLGKDNWRSWETGERSVIWGGGGKRAHVRENCPDCEQTNWHRTSWMVGSKDTWLSAPHHLPWVYER